MTDKEKLWCRRLRVESDRLAVQLSALSANLRKLEQKFPAVTHIPIVASPQESGMALDRSNLNQAILPGPPEADQFTRTAMQLSQQLRKSPLLEPLTARMGGDPAIFDDAEFADQVCSDSELMVEIIDLYLEESRQQIAAMRLADQEGRLTDLSRVAHTIKGSLGSLHAGKARGAAQEVESSAKAGEAIRASEALSRLFVYLRELEPVLKQFRDNQAAC